MTKTPSPPTDTRMFPPSPISIERPGATGTVVIVTVSMTPAWPAAVIGKAAQASRPTARARRIEGLETVDGDETAGPMARRILVVAMSLRYGRGSGTFDSRS